MVRTISSFNGYLFYNLPMFFFFYTSYASISSNIVLNNLSSNFVDSVFDKDSLSSSIVDFSVD